MNKDQICELLLKVKDGSLTIDEAVEKLRHLPFEDLGFARVDHHRQIRCGFPEVIYCPGKTTEQIVGIFERLAQKGNNVLASRAGQEVYDALMMTGKYAKLQYDAVARAVTLVQKPTQPSDHYIAVITAGTADLPVAMEAKITCEIMGQQARLLADVGVAGLHRLLNNLQVLHQASVIIVVAGMEGALASVVGGLVGCPVIAVPTSVGYGASFEGLAALLTMLNSCASGITVVNIDNGFGAGYAASIINSKINRNQG
ncbi:MAG: nickel pincer cofactor biosynthesis protein LarB [Sedimentisphaerales bacterium]|nr:nickel pincer cofactor biosynthesis protein LarB [Sedimentisphaerales bacterium]